MLTVITFVFFQATGFQNIGKLNAISNVILRNYIYGTGLGSSVGRVSAPRSGGTGFDPGP